MPKKLCSKGPLPILKKLEFLREFNLIESYFLLLNIEFSFI